MYHGVISDVTITPDLRHARVYVVGGGLERDGNVMSALNKSKAVFKRNMAKKLRLRHIPDISFHEDVSFEKASQIEKKIHDLHFTP